MVPATVTQNIIPILTFGVTFNLINGSIVVIVAMNAPYRLKTFIASCPKMIIKNMIKAKFPNRLAKLPPE